MKSNAITQQDNDIPSGEPHNIKYEELFSQSHIPIVLVNAKTGFYVEANSAAESFFGISKMELTKLNFFDLKIPEFDGPAIEKWISSKDQGEHMMLECSIQAHDGNFHSVILNGKLFQHSTPPLLQLYIEDLTDLKACRQKQEDLKKKLTQQEQFSGVGRLAAGLAHEIKNPLAAIRNGVYFIRNMAEEKKTVIDQNQIRSVLEVVEEEVDSAVRIIEELLDYAHASPLLPRRTTIETLISKSVSAVSIPKNINCEYQLDPQIEKWTLDPEQIRKILNHLILNAVQAMQNGGTLTLSTSSISIHDESSNTKQDWLQITVSDTGIGIHKNQLEKIFDPLYSSKINGTGLGLCICQNIVAKHKGKITVQSEVGKGSHFNILIPPDLFSNTEEITHAQ